MDHSMHNYAWLNPPEEYQISQSELFFKTRPHTDFWQQTYYGFRYDNGHLFSILISQDSFTYSLQTKYIPQEKYDQAGIMV
ncbi:MAG: DUF1349 domain-containing protein, partial [Anaerolineales bacterium]